MEGTILLSHPVNGIYLYPEIKQLLEFLKKNNIKCFIWTSRDRESTLNILKQAQLLTYFEDIKCCFTDCEAKPSFEGIEQMLSLEEAKNTLLIGDSNNDIIAGNDFGAITIKVTWYYDEFKNITDKEILENFDLDELLKGKRDRDINALHIPDLKLGHPLSISKLFFDN